jgi:ATP-dependent DNA helicase DinG
VSEFRPSLLERGRKRTVHTLADRQWQVAGQPSLGDHHASYVVTLSAGARKYHCQCYESNGGAARQHRMCSHVMAVILHRQQVPAVVRAADGEVEPPFSTSPSSSAGMGREASSHSWASQGADTGQADTDLTYVPSPQDPMFDGQLPEWVESIRPHQWTAVQEIKQAFDDGCEVVFLDAPTGSGKTLIGRMVSILLESQTSYVCSDKSLQNQFHTDFADAAMLKGRANYTSLSGSDCGKCIECTVNPPPKEEPNELPACAYKAAKKIAVHSPLALLNTSYLLTEANFIGQFTDRELVIVDECDVLEKELMGFLEIALPAYKGIRYGIGRPQFVTKKDSIVEWLEDEAIPAVLRYAEKLQGRVVGIRSQIRNEEATKRAQLKVTLAALLEEKQQVLRDAKKLEVALAGVQREDWVFMDYAGGGATFKPIRVQVEGQNSLWRHAGRWLLMSATVISADELADSLGFKGRYATVKVPMTFPVENRRIHVAPVASMTAKLAETEWPKLAKALERILEKHSDERVLVHTVSYKLAEFLDSNLLDKRVMVYKGAGERAEVLEKFRNTEGAVLLAPSMDRGVDLKHDDCRVVVVAKVPFPYMGDKQINERLHSPGGNRWYQVQAIRSLVQMTGRAVRSKDDWCVSYILDAQFPNNLWKKASSLFPDWWSESLDWEFPTKSLR